jgi:hypothetical protein
MLQGRVLLPVGSPLIPSGRADSAYSNWLGKMRSLAQKVVLGAIAAPRGMHRLGYAHGAAGSMPVRRTQLAAAIETAEYPGLAAYDFGTYFGNSALVV